MVRIFEMQRAAALLAAVLLSSLALTGCVSDTPRTALDWYPQSDAPPVPRHVADNHAPRPPHHRPRTTPPVQAASADCPPGQHRPAWYTQNNVPPPRPAAPQNATYTDISPDAGSTTFAWPLQGRIIADFGSTASGGRNDGINIAVASGTPIHAAAAGQISYSGNELRGYGNLVLIKHDDGYVTAYAHADRIVVNRGDFVTKGQIIAYAGQTGDVTTPQLHFEIRKGVQPINPRALLTSRTASAY